MMDRIQLESELLTVKALINGGLALQEQGYTDSMTVYEEALKKIVALINSCK